MTVSKISVKATQPSQDQAEAPHKTWGKKQRELPDDGQISEKDTSCKWEVHWEEGKSDPCEQQWTEDRCELGRQQKSSWTQLNLREAEKARLHTKYPAKPYWKKEFCLWGSRIGESSALESLTEYHCIFSLVETSRKKLLRKIWTVN